MHMCVCDSDLPIYTHVGLLTKTSYTGSLCIAIYKSISYQYYVEILMSAGYAAQNTNKLFLLIIIPTFITVFSIAI